MEVLGLSVEEFYISPNHPLIKDCDFVVDKCIKSEDDYWIIYTYHIQTKEGRSYIVRENYEKLPSSRRIRFSHG